MCRPNRHQINKERRDENSYWGGEIWNDAATSVWTKGKTGAEDDIDSVIMYVGPSTSWDNHSMQSVYQLFYCFGCIQPQSHTV